MKRLEYLRLTEDKQRDEHYCALCSDSSRDGVFVKRILIHHAFSSTDSTELRCEHLCIQCVLGIATAAVMQGKEVVRTEEEDDS